MHIVMASRANSLLESIGTVSVFSFGSAEF
jgi:hypothetical protein